MKKFDASGVNACMGDIKSRLLKLDRIQSFFKLKQKKIQKKLFQLLKKSKFDSSNEKESNVGAIIDVFHKQPKLDYTKAAGLDPAAQRFEDRFSDVMSIPSDEEETALRQRLKPLEMVGGDTYNVLVINDKRLD